MLTSKVFVGYNYFTFFFYRFSFLLFSLFLFTLTVTAGLNDPRVAYWEPGRSHFYFYWLRLFISFFVFFVSHFSCLNLHFLLFFAKNFTTILYIISQLFLFLLFFYLRLATICYFCEKYHFIKFNFLFFFNIKYRILLDTSDTIIFIYNYYSKCSTYIISKFIYCFIFYFFHFLIHEF